MIKLENFEVVGWEHAIRGMRNPKNSWDRMDTHYCGEYENCEGCPALGEDDRCTVWGTNTGLTSPIVGPNDHELMMKLAKGGPVHAKYRRMIDVYVDITAPLYWWKEFDTYKVGTVANSCSTMHTIHKKEFTLDDFSCEHLAMPTRSHLVDTVKILNMYRNLFVNWDQKNDNTKNAFLTGVFDGVEYNKKDAWHQIIQLLPSSYNQKRTVKLNYEVLANIYKWRKNHKLDEWVEFCKWIEQLPYSEIITGPSLSDIPIADEIMVEAERRVREKLEEKRNDL